MYSSLVEGMPSWETSVDSYYHCPICMTMIDASLLPTAIAIAATGTTIPIQKERNTQQPQQQLEFQPKKYREAPDLVSEGGGSGGGNSSSTSSVSVQYHAMAVRPVNDFVGNYFYASPEIVCGTGLYDQSVDWWAVGVMLFHLLAGITPFEAEQKDVTLGTSPIVIYSDLQ